MHFVLLRVLFRQLAYEFTFKETLGFNYHKKFPFGMRSLSERHSIVKKIHASINRIKLIDCHTNYFLKISNLNNAIIIIVSQINLRLL